MSAQVVSEGTGAEHPAKNSPCECHYEGRTAQEFDKDPKGANTFDSSYKRGSPTTFAPNQVMGVCTAACRSSAAPRYCAMPRPYTTPRSYAMPRYCAMPRSSATSGSPSG